MKMQVAVCDVCQEKDAGAFEVRFPDGVLRADLCDRHAKPLVDLRTLVPRLFSASGQRRRTKRVVVDPGAI